MPTFSNSLKDTPAQAYSSGSLDPPDSWEQHGNWSAKPRSAPTTSGIAVSIGPLPLTDEFEQQWKRVGDCLAASFKLRGLFGVDAVIRHGQIFPVEINPRYTASIEILEAGNSWSSIDLHRAACLDERVTYAPHHADSTTYFGKAILFARHCSVVTDELREWIDRANDSSDGPYAADIPCAEVPIAARQPVLTVFTRSDAMDQVIPRLQQRAAEVAERLLRREPDV